MGFLYMYLINFFVLEFILLSSLSSDFPKLSQKEFAKKVKWIMPCIVFWPVCLLLFMLGAILYFIFIIISYWLYKIFYSFTWWITNQI